MDQAANDSYMETPHIPNVAGTKEGRKYNCLGRDALFLDPNGQLSGNPLVMEDPSSRYNKVGCKRGEPLFKIKGERLHVTNMVSFGTNSSGHAGLEGYQRYTF